MHETPPEPPQKEDSPRVARNAAAANRISLRGQETMESVSLDDDEGAGSGGGGLAEGRGSPERHREQGPQGPVFDISVGDPHKVGDLTSAHTVYQVRTKVGFLLCCVIGSLMWWG